MLSRGQDSCGRRFASQRRDRKRIGNWRGVRATVSRDQFSVGDFAAAGAALVSLYRRSKIPGCEKKLVAPARETPCNCNIKL
jgi:hypothetical protein